MADTAVFKFHDGEKERYADPFAVFKALHYHSARIKADWADLWNRSIKDDILESYEPWALLLPILYEVFGLVPFDPATGQGVTADVAENVMNAFVAFMNAKKKPAAS